MPHRYKVAVGSGGPEANADPFFTSWESFVQDRSRGHGDGAQPRHLCDVLVDAANGGTQADATRAWPTLVVGSECLRLRSLEAERAVTLLPAALKAQLDNLPGIARDSRERKLLPFATQLIKDRLGLESMPLPSPAGPLSPNEDATRWSDEDEPVSLSNMPDDAPLSRLTPVEERAARETATSVVRGYEPWEIDLIEATAALTECYFTAKARMLHSVSRSSTETLRLDAADGSLRDRADLELGDLADKLAEQPTDDTWLLDVVRDMRTSLGRGLGEIPLAGLVALTEITWGVMTGSLTLYSSYPEWSEFLVRLSMDKGRSRLIRQGPPRPAPRSAVDAAGLVVGALEGLTRQSANWHGGAQPADEASRVSAYSAYADLLCELAAYRASRLPSAPKGLSLPASSTGATSLQVAPLSDAAKAKGETWSDASLSAGRTASAPPPASAFVTTFDLELEFAVAQRHPNQAFVVAVPVNLIDNAEGMNDQRLASTMWLGCVIQPDPGRALYDRIVNPPHDAWFAFGAELQGNRQGVDGDPGGADPESRLIRRALPAGVPRLGALPIIVRLAGSPLMRLPELQDPNGVISDLGEVLLEHALLDSKVDRGLSADGTRTMTTPTWNRGGEVVDIQLVHATLLDEHNAVRLSLPEVVKDQKWGLPHDLTTPASGAFWRYWILLGVELSDPVIRYRVVSQILGAGLINQTAEARRPKHTGLALNRKPLNARAIDILLWCGFDIVGDVEAPASITPELSHYLAHLRDENARNWPWKGRGCGLEEALAGRESADV